jgi:hypothetical protein
VQRSLLIPKERRGTPGITPKSAKETPKFCFFGVPGAIFGVPGD